MEQSTDQIRIKGFLKRLFDQRALLTVKLLERQEDFTTMLIGIEAEHNQLLLDALRPDVGNALIGQLGKAVIRGNVDGINLSFETQLIATQIENNIPLHVITFPTVINYLQRRETIRIKLGAARALTVALSLDKTLSFEGQILDISAGGLGIQVEKKLPPQVEVGQRLQCSFRLPLEADQSITSDVIVRIINPPIPGRNHSFLGVQFIDLLKPQQRLLEKAIMNLQRLAQQRRVNEEDDRD